MKDINFFKIKDSLYFKKIRSKKELEKSSFDEDGYLLDCSELEARKIIAFLKSKNQEKLIAFKGSDNQTNRRALEKLKINYLVSPEISPKKDSIKQRDSGLNHVLGRIAKEKSISILIDFNDLKKIDKKEKIKRISRLIQNIKLCKKTGCKIKIASFGKDDSEIVLEKEKESFLQSMGASSAQSKNCSIFP